MSLRLFFFAFKNRAQLEKEYAYHTSQHEDSHYGTFEQFKDLVKVISSKQGFSVEFDDTNFELKSSKGIELSFSTNSFRGYFYSIIVTTEWKARMPNEKELVWQVMPDGQKLLLPNTKITYGRNIEHFVFASIQDYIQFRYWMHNAKANSETLNASAEEKALMAKKLKDINANYWLMSAENKKIFNMKVEEVDKILELDKFEKEFAKLPKVSKDQKLIGRGK